MPPLTLGILRERIVARREELARLGADGVSIFGSFAKNEQRTDSDIDLAIELRPGYGYFDLGEIKARLDADFGVPVNPVVFTSDAESRFGQTFVRVF